MITPCSIKDIYKLEPIATESFGEESTMWLRYRIQSQFHKLFLSPDSYIISYHRIGTYKYAIHLIGSAIGNKVMKEFVIGCNNWMFDNTKCSCILSFVDESNRKLQIAERYAGFKKVGVIPNAGGDSNEILYICNKG